MDMGEKRVTELVNQILSAKTCQGNKGGLRENHVELRKKAEELFASLCSLLELPTRKDLDDLSHRLEVLNGKVVSLTLKMEKLVEQQHKKTDGLEKAEASSQKATSKRGGAKVAE